MGAGRGCILHSGVAGLPILVEIRLIDGQKLLEPGTKLRFARQGDLGEMKKHDTYHPELRQ